MKTRRALCIGLSSTIAALLVVGCGGNGAKEAGGTPAGQGRVSVSINWGNNTRFVPPASNAVALVLSKVATQSKGATEVDRHVLVRPAAGSMPPGWTFGGLGPGTYSLSATAYPEGDEQLGTTTGVAQAKGDKPDIVVTADAATSVSLSMDSTIKSIKTVADKTTASVGELVTFTTTAYDGDNGTGNVVLVPASVTPQTQVVSGGDRVEPYADASGRAATDKYVYQCIALADGPVQVQCALPAGAVSDAAMVSSVEDIGIDSSVYIVDPDRKGYMFHEYQERYAGNVGKGYNDKTGEVRGSSPFQSGFTTVLKENPTGQKFEAHWDDVVTSEDSGQAWDMGLEARYANASGGVHTNFEKRQICNSRTVAFSVTYVDNMGRWELDPSQLTLTRAAARLLSEPQKFLDTYGHRLIVGERRVKRVVATFRMQVYDQSQASAMGVQWNASYGTMATKVSTHGSWQTFLKTASKHTRIDVSVSSTNGMPENALAPIEKPGDVDTFVQSIQKLLDDQGGDPNVYLVDRYVSVPMTDFIPALNQLNVTLPAIKEEQLRSEFELYCQINRMLKYAREIKTTFGAAAYADPYSWMIAADHQAVVDAVPTLESRRAFMLNRVKALIQEQELEPLTGDNALPPIINGWPAPVIVGSVQCSQKGTNLYQFTCDLVVKGVGPTWNHGKVVFRNPELDGVIELPCADWQGAPGEVLFTPAGENYTFHKSTNHQPVDYTGWIRPDGSTSSQYGHKFFLYGREGIAGDLWVELYGENDECFLRRNLNKTVTSSRSTGPASLWSLLSVPTT